MFTACFIIPIQQQQQQKTEKSNVSKLEEEKDNDFN